MSVSIVIVADDLTGAADCGIACTAAGLDTVVVFGEISPALDIVADAIAFDADTRRRPPEIAGAATELAVRRLCAGGGVRVLYKKIDSTLRGNFAVEIAAAHRSSRGGLLAHGSAGNSTAPAPPLAIVAPAFPATGRTTRGGRMYLHGTPLEESEVWRNEEISGLADLTALLKSDAGLRAESVPLETIHAGVESLRAALAMHAAAGVEAVTCDAETDDDLRIIAHAAARLPHPAVFAGSAGLARHLPHAFGLAQNRESLANLTSVRYANEESAPRLPESRRPISGSKAASQPLLFVVGSMSQVSREQFHRLTEESDVRALTLSPTALREGPGSVRWRDAMRLLNEALDGNADVALALGLGEGINLGESEFLSGALAHFLLPFIRRLGGLFCTGGETARDLLNAAGAVGIRLVGEVEPGVPLGTVEGLQNLPIVTKAGAFGTPHTLVRCRVALHRFISFTNSTLTNSPS